MEFITMGAMKTKLKDDLDLIAEDIITDSELTTYVQRSIKHAEALIHTVYEDYFLTKTNLSLTTGNRIISLPSDIYAAKIRGIVYDDSGNRRYEIRPIRDFKDIPFILDEEDYSYVLRNLEVGSEEESKAGMVLDLYPVSRETSTTNVTMWYLRRAKKPLLDTDNIDIPEFFDFLEADISYRIIKDKDRDLAVLNDFRNERNMLRKEMVESLSNKVPDENNQIPPEFSFYADFDHFNFYASY